jgi:elongation factor G
LVKSRALKRVNICFVNQIRSELFSRIFPGCEKAKEAVQKGVIAGYPLDEISITLMMDLFHEVDSSEFAFRYSFNA